MPKTIIQKEAIKAVQIQVSISYFWSETSMVYAAKKNLSLRFELVAK